MFLYHEVRGRNRRDVQKDIETRSGESDMRWKRKRILFHCPTVSKLEYAWALGSCRREDEGVEIPRLTQLSPTY